MRNSLACVVSLTLFVTGCLVFSPSRAAGQATVVIDNAQTTTQDLDVLYGSSTGPHTAAVTSSGSVTMSTGNAVTSYLSKAWSLSNEGVIEGKSGVYFNLGGSVSNAGQITGTGGDSQYGIYLGNGAGATNSITNSATGTIIGGSSTTSGTAIRAFTVTPFSLQNSGIIRSYGIGSVTYGVLADGTASIVNGKDAEIIGGYGGTRGIGIYALGHTSVQNDGIISGNGTSGHGVYLAAGGSVVNQADGDIVGGGGTGGSGIGVGIIGNGWVDNSGSIIGNGNQGVYIVGNGMVRNRTGGAIVASGSTIGVQVTGGTADITNEENATISGGNNGVVVSGSGKVANSGTISGTVMYGVRFSNANSGTYETTVTNNRTITGATAGVSANFSHASAAGTNTLTNSGVITSGAGSGVLYQGKGIFTNAIENSGIVSGELYGVNVVFSDASGGTNSLTNSGIISSAKGSGLLYQGMGAFSNTFENSGIISGSTYGAELNMGTVSNRGTIQGATGISFTAGVGDTLTNTGAIRGSSGTAIDMGGGNDSVILGTGSSIIGLIDGGIGTDTITLRGSGGIDLGQIANFEEFVKEGKGYWTLTGTGFSGGNVLIDSGTLVLKGTLNSPLTIGASGILKGTGTASSVNNLGRIAPGESIGTLRINGDYTHGSGAVYEAEIDPSGSSDKIVVTGKATLKGGAVQVIGGTGTYSEGATYNILHAKGGVTGTFSSLESDLAFLAPSLTYDSDDVFLKLIRTSTDFVDVASTFNQRAVASAIDQASYNASGDMTTTINALLTLSGLQARNAFDQIGGASYTAFAPIDASRTSLFMRQLFSPEGRTSLTASSLAACSEPAAGRSFSTPGAVSGSGRVMAEPAADKWSLWTKSYGWWGNRDGIDIASRYSYDIAGVMAGFEVAPVNSLRAGLSFGYARTNLDLSDLHDNGDAESYQAALYGTYAWGRWYTDAVLYHSWNNYDMQRPISFGGIDRTARGRFDGFELAGYIEEGYRYTTSNEFTITPMASLLAIKHHRDDFSETGADSLDLIVGSDDTLSVRSGLGVKVSRQFGFFKNLIIIPEISARWLHEFGDDTWFLSGTLAGNSAASFMVRSDKASRDSGLFAAGITGLGCRNISFVLNYESNVSDRVMDHAVIGGLKYSW